MAQGGERTPTGPEVGRTAKLAPHVARQVALAAETTAPLSRFVGAARAMAGSGHRTVRIAPNPLRNTPMGLGQVPIGSAVAMQLVRCPSHTVCLRGGLSQHRNAGSRCVHFPAEMRLHFVRDYIEPRYNSL